MGSFSKSSVAHADPVTLTPKETGELIELFQLCEKALNACGEDAANKQELVHEQELLITEQATEISDLRADRKKLWKNPILWGVVGALAGGLATAIIIK
jgi:hypothetical protein